jgi:hypothetical protein
MKQHIIRTLYSGRVRGSDPESAAYSGLISRYHAFTTASDTVVLPALPDGRTKYIGTRVQHFPCGASGEPCVSFIRRRRSRNESDGEQIAFSSQCSCDVNVIAYNS